MGCRHSSVDSYAASILPPQVRVPSTPSMFLSHLSLDFEKNKKEARFGPFKKIVTQISLDVDDDNDDDDDEGKKRTRTTMKKKMRQFFVTTLLDDLTICRECCTWIVGKADCTHERHLFICTKHCVVS